jgi:hypothetical protein
MTDNFGYAFCSDKTLVSTIVGAALISPGNYGYYPLDNNAPQGSSIYFVDGFSDDEKWITLSNGIKNNKIGPADISFVISGGAFSIPAQDSLKVGFAIAAGETLNELRTAIIQSRIKYRGIISSINEGDKNIPKDFRLYQNYPNPFNPSTAIKYNVPAGGLVTLRIYDLLGREVTTLINEYQQPGIHNFTFNTQNYSLPSGVYFYQLNAGGSIQTKKMILLK